MPTFKAQSRWTPSAGHQNTTTQKGYVFQFGKYKGMSIENDSVIKESYLEFLISSNKSLIKECEKELERRRSLEYANDTMIGKVIEAGFRAMAKELHPDTGSGTTEEFMELQGARTVLREIAENLK